MRYSQLLKKNCSHGLGTEAFLIPKCLEICQPEELTRDNVKVIPELPFFYADETVLIQCTDTGKVLKATCIPDPPRERKATWSVSNVDCSVLFENVSLHNSISVETLFCLFRVRARQTLSHSPRRVGYDIRYMISGVRFRILESPNIITVIGERCWRNDKLGSIRLFWLHRKSCGQPLEYVYRQFPLFTTWQRQWPYYYSYLTSPSHMPKLEAAWFSINLSFADLNAATLFLWLVPCWHF